MRETNTPLNQSAVPQESRIRQVGYDVSAAPVSLSANDSELRAAQQLAQDMAAFTGKAEQFSQGQSEQVIQNEQEKAVVDAIHDPNVEPVMTADQSAWYQTARMKMFAATKANQAVSDLAVEIERIKDNPELLGNTSPQEFLDKWYKEKAAGVTDPDVAAALYPALEKAVSSGRMELIKAKQKALNAQFAQDAATTADSLIKPVLDKDGQPVLDANGYPRIIAPTPEQMWATIGTMVQSGIPKAQAMAAVVERLAAAYHSGRQLDIVDLLRTTGPNGVSFFNTADDKFPFRNTVNSLLSNQTTTRERIKLEDDQRKAAEQQQQYNNVLRALRYNVENRGEIDQAAFANLSYTDQLDILQLQNNFNEKQAKEKSNEAVMLKAQQLGLGPDQFVSNPEEHKVMKEGALQAWTTGLNNAMQSANAQVAQGGSPEKVYDSTEAGSLKSTLTEIFTLSTGKYSTVPLDFISVNVNGVEHLPMLGQTPDGKVPDKYRFSALVFNVLDGNPQLQGLLPKVFDAETLAFHQQVKLTAGTDSYGDQVRQYKTVREARAVPNRDNLIKDFNTDKDNLRKKVIGSTAEAFELKLWGFGIDSVDSGSVTAAINSFVTDGFLQAAYMNARGDTTVMSKIIEGEARKRFTVEDVKFYNSKGFNMGRNLLVALPDEHMQKYWKDTGIDTAKYGYTKESWPQMLSVTTTYVEKQLKESNRLDPHETITLIPRPDGRAFKIWVAGRGEIGNAEVPAEVPFKVYSLVLEADEAATPEQKRGNIPHTSIGRAVAALGWSPKTYRDDKVAAYVKPIMDEQARLKATTPQLSREGLLPTNSMMNVGPSTEASTKAPPPPAVPVPQGPTKPSKTKRDSSSAWAEGGPPPTPGKKGSIPLPALPDGLTASMNSMGMPEIKLPPATVAQAKK